MLLLHELEEGAFRIRSRHDDFRVELIAILEDDAHRPSAFDLDLLHTRTDPDLDSKRLRRVVDRAADPARTILGKPPGAEGPVDLTHVMVQQHIRRPRRARTQERADDPTGCLRAFQPIGLEPLLQQVRRGLCGESGDHVQFLFREAFCVLADLEQTK